METWKIQALLAALFAGLTSVLAKSGMKALGADLALAVRTFFVFVFISANTLFFLGPQPLTPLRQATSRDLWLLKEPFTPKIACGAMLILAGILTLSSK